MTPVNALALERLAMAPVLAGIACGLILAFDLVRRPQKMWIMNLVWPIAALYAGPLAIWAYWVMGRAGSAAERKGKPFWQSVLVGAMHCGAGCTLGDLAGEGLIAATGLLLLGSLTATRLIVTFALAYVAGLAFQFFAIAPMRGLGLRDGLVAAAKADTLSLLAYQLGMFAFMLLIQATLLPHLAPASWLFWMVMQGAMLVGLLATYPVNVWLIRAGVKEAM